MLCLWIQMRDSCDLGGGFVLCDQTTEITSRSTNIFLYIHIYTLSDRHKIFRSMNIYTLSARHCGPHPSSMKKSILNWRDWLFQVITGRTTPPKHFGIFPPISGGCLKGLDTFIFFFKHDKRPVAIQREMPGKVCSCWTSIARAAYWLIVVSDPLGLAMDSTCVFFFEKLPTNHPHYFSSSK